MSFNLIPCLLFDLSFDTQERGTEQIPEGLFPFLVKLFQAKLDLFSRLVFECSKDPVPKNKDVCKVGVCVFLILIMVNLVQIRRGEEQSCRAVQPRRKPEIGMLQNQKRSQDQKIKSNGEQIQSKNTGS